VKGDRRENLWSQGGLIHEPERQEEREALLLLWNASVVKQTRSSFAAVIGSTGPGGSFVHRDDGVAAG
jgi:hypothetical protein